MSFASLPSMQSACSHGSLHCNTAARSTNRADKTLPRIRVLTFHQYSTDYQRQCRSKSLPSAVCDTVCVLHRAAGREEDSRWLSGTYLLVHPAAKHLGHARVRLKVLLELNPQSSGRASSRQWQVPHIAPTVIRAAGYSPRRLAAHGATLRPRESNMHDPLRASAQAPSHGAGEGPSLGSTQRQPTENVTAHHSMAVADYAEPVLLHTAKAQDTSKSLDRVDDRSQPSASEGLTVSGLSTRAHRPLNPPQGSLAAPRSGERGLPMSPPQVSPAGPKRDEEGYPLQAPQGSSAAQRSGVADPPPVCQGATGPAEGQPPHPHAVSSTAVLPPFQGSSQTSPGQGQGSAAGQLGTAADDRSASAQVKAHVILNKLVLLAPSAVSMAALALPKYI